MKKDFGTLFKESINEYGEKFISILRIFIFLYLIPVFAIGMIVGLLVISFFGVNFLENLSIGGTQITFDTLTNFNPDLQSNLTILVLIALIVLILFALFILLQFIASLCYLNLGFLKKKEVSFREIFNKSRDYLWIYIGLVIIQSLALFGLFLLLIIPGIIFSIYWIFSVYVLIYEKKGILDSMKESKKLVEGKWWEIFSYTLLIFLIIIAITIAAGFIPVIGSFIPYLVTTPFIIFFYKNLYLDLKEDNKKIKRK